MNEIFLDDLRERVHPVSRSAMKHYCAVANRMAID